LVYIISYHLHHALNSFCIQDGPYLLLLVIKNEVATTHIMTHFHAQQCALHTQYYSLQSLSCADKYFPVHTSNKNKYMVGKIDHV